MSRYIYFDRYSVSGEEYVEMENRDTGKIELFRYSNGAFTNVTSELSGIEEDSVGTIGGKGSIYAISTGVRKEFHDLHVFREGREQIISDFSPYSVTSIDNLGDTLLISTRETLVTLAFSPAEKEVLTSGRINGMILPVTSATLHANIETSANSSITFFLSNDEGRTWNRVNNNEKYSFSTSSNDLRWKAEFSLGSNRRSPILHALTLDLTYEKNFADWKIYSTADSLLYSTLDPRMQFMFPKSLDLEENLDHISLSEGTGSKISNISVVIQKEPFESNLIAACKEWIVRRLTYSTNLKFTAEQEMLIDDVPAVKLAYIVGENKHEYISKSGVVACISHPTRRIILYGVPNDSDIVKTYFDYLVHTVQFFSTPSEESI